MQLSFKAGQNKLYINFEMKIYCDEYFTCPIHCDIRTNVSDLKELKENLQHNGFRRVNIKEL